MTGFPQFKNLKHFNFRVFAILVGALIIMSLPISAYIKFKSPADPPQQIIAITQITSHPSLDLIHQGIIDELTQSDVFKNNNYKIVFENAQGNISTATQIAQKFVGLKPKVIVAITTPSAQIIKSAIKNTPLKMVFSAVTDPVGAQLVPDFIDHDAQITGNVDIPPIADQLKIILKYCPAAKHIGVVYNPGEINSVNQIAKLKELAQKMGVEIILSPATKSVDVGSATLRLMGKVEAIYVPNDNTVVSAIESLIKIADKHKILVLTSDPESIAKGAHLSLANNQYQVGRDTGKVVYRVLSGEDIAHIPVQATASAQLLVNKDKLRLLGLAIS